LKIYYKLFIFILLSTLIVSNIYSEESNFSFDICSGPFLPDMTTNTLKNPTQNSYFTYEDFYGETGTYNNLLHLDYFLINHYGVLAFGIETGYIYDKGHALIKEANGNYSSSGEALYLQIIPANIVLKYNFDYFNNQVIVPYIEVGGSYWAFKEESQSGNKIEGAKKGYFYGGGLKLLLDPFDPSSAANLSIDYGISHTYIFIGYRFYKINYKGSGFDFSQNNWLAGFSFSF